MILFKGQTDILSYIEVLGFSINKKACLLFPKGG
jgi:hypothetical protein